MPVIELTTEVCAPLERVFDLSRSIELHVASAYHTGERAVAGFPSPLGIPGRIADRLFFIEYMRRFLLTRHTMIKTVAETEQWHCYLHA